MAPMEFQGCHWKDEKKSLENDIKNAGIGVTVWKWQAIQKCHLSAITASSHLNAMR